MGIFRKILDLQVLYTIVILAFLKVREYCSNNGSRITFKGCWTNADCPADLGKKLNSLPA